MKNISRLIYKTSPGPRIIPFIHEPLYPQFKIDRVLGSQSVQQRRFVPIQSRLLRASSTPNSGCAGDETRVTRFGGVSSPCFGHFLVTALWPAIENSGHARGETTLSPLPCESTSTTPLSWGVRARFVHFKEVSGLVSARLFGYAMYQVYIIFLLLDVSCLLYNKYYLVYRIPRGRNKCH